MKYNNYLEKSPLVSEIGLGAWQLGEHSGWRNMSEKQAIKMVHTALDLGVNFFDTAPNYGLGTSEVRIGKALKGYDRSKVVINTKFGHTVDGNLNFDANYIRESVEGSLKRLQVDYIDSLIFHNPPQSYLDGRNNPHYDILDKLIDEGKMNGYGASLDSYSEMKLFMDTTNCGVVEVFFNMLHQDTAKGFDNAFKNDISVIVKIPLDSGWLSGKYDAATTFSDIRSRWTRADIVTRSYLINALKKILEPEKNLAKSALSFCLNYDAVSTVIPGNTTIDQLKRNLKSIEYKISPNLVEKIECFYQSEVKKLDLPW